MDDNYFGNFPLISYNGVTTRNITERVTVNVMQNPSAVPTIYLPYDLNNMRADTVASSYYNSSVVDWIIYLTNGIIDPYYDWHLYAQDFDDYIIQKYGSIAFAQELIAFYRNNWADNNINISVSFFNSLSADQQKYYTPIFGPKQSIQAYARRQSDWIVNTNMIVQFDLTLNNATPFANNELIGIFNNQLPTGGCQIIAQSLDGTTITVQHVSGNTGVGNTLIGTISNAVATITTSTILSQPLSNSEAVFWSPVFFYDLENEKNTKNQSIYLLDSSQLLPVLTTINKKLQS